MDWWWQLLVVWFSIDVIVLATGWYIISLKPYFPNWWERVIACEVPSDIDLEREVIDPPKFGIESKWTN